MQKLRIETGGRRQFLALFNVDGQQLMAFFLDIYSQMHLFVFFTPFVLFFHLCCFYSESDAGHLFVIWHLWFIGQGAKFEKKTKKKPQYIYIYKI